MSEEVSKVSLQRIRLAVFAFYFCQGLVFSSWASRIPDIKSFMGMDDANWGTMLLMISVGQMCGMTMSGFLVSQFGSKKILLAILPCYTFILLPISLVSNEYGMIIVLLLYGIFANFMNISINTQGINVETLYDKQIMSSFHGGWSLAGFVGSLIGLLMINIGFSPLYHFSIIVCIVMIILITNFKYLPIDIKKESVLTEGKVNKRKKPEKFLFVLGIVAFCGMFIEGTMFDWSGVYFEDIVKAPRTLIPLGFVGFMIMMASGRFIADKAIRRWSRRLIIQVCGVLAGIGLSIAVVFPNIIITTIAFMIIGLGVSTIVPTIYSVAGQKTKISTGLALTVVSSISFLGFLLGPPVIGYISKATNLRYSYAFAGIFAIIIVVLVSQIKILKKDATFK